MFGLLVPLAKYLDAIHAKICCETNLNNQPINKIIAQNETARFDITITQYSISNSSSLISSLRHDSLSFEKLLPLSELTSSSARKLADP